MKNFMVSETEFKKWLIQDMIPSYQRDKSFIIDAENTPDNIRQMIHVIKHEYPELIAAVMTKALTDQLDTTIDQVVLWSILVIIVDMFSTSLNVPAEISIKLADIMAKGLGKGV